MTKSIVLLSCCLLLASSASAFSPRSALVAPATTANSISNPTLTTRTRTTSSLLMATTPVAADATELDQDAITKKTPIILLAGFLGTGKTTALKHLLENTDGAKIGVIVNDVASVNIDAKLVSSMPESASEDMIELQNGCACCSLSDELFTSVETLFKPKPKSKEKRNYDAIVVELSGVADPMAIAATWKAAEGSDRFEATKIASISKIVTMIDSCTFGTDYMTWDSAAQRPGWADTGDECAGNRKVAELLAEQVEAANLILVNKIDLATPEEVQVATKVARALNENAVLHEVKFGIISPKEILEMGTTGVKTGPMENVKEEKVAKVEVVEAECEEKDCTDTSHSHNHDDHAEAACEETDCTDTSHSHNHDDHAAEAACEDTACTDSSHSHNHDDHKTDEEACIDPGCGDTSHEHSHSHSTSTDNLGITNFVYKAARPFQTSRLMALLNTWPVPIKDTLDIEGLSEDGSDANDDYLTNKQDSPFMGVLRSKGFCWMAPTKWNGANDDAYRHDTAMYWSHAGKHFGLAANGKWWGSIQMYDGWENYMKKLFKDNDSEFDRILKEDFVSEEFADRRQELVFIGIGLEQDPITKALDDCLLTDDELDNYRQKLKNYQDTVLTSSGGKGLFDMDGGTEYTDA